MTATWSDSESALEHARSELAERYPGEAVEIVEMFDLGWVGWECDFQGALITRDGVPELVIVDATGVGRSNPVAVTLRERLVEYGRLIVETGAVLRRHQKLLLEHVKAAIDERGPPEDLDEVRRRFDAAMAEIAPYFTEPGNEMPADVADAIDKKIEDDQ